VDSMPAQQKIFILVAGMAIIWLIVDLVRRGRLREEFSWIWILCAVLGMVFGLWHQLQVWFMGVTGAKVSTSVVFMFAIFALGMLNLHAATRISALNRQVKTLAQEIALLRSGKSD